MCQGVIYLATDATPWSVGWVELKDGKVVKTGYEEWKTEEDQVIMEMRGFLIGVRAVTEQRREARIVGVVDAEIVRRVVEKGYSRSPRLRSQLRELRDLVQGRQLRVEVGRVTGVDNAADAVSRSDPLEEDKVKITWKSLMAM